MPATARQELVVELQHLQDLLASLREKRFQAIGPTVRDGAIIYDDLSSIEDLPRGWTQEQEGGTYRLRQRDDEALFGYAMGPHFWKRLLHPRRPSAR